MSVLRAIFLALLLDTAVLLQASPAEEHGDVALLNAHAFYDSVLHGSSTGDWIVLFCHEHDSRCHKLTPSFQALASCWEAGAQTISAGLRRFGAVDCVAESTLCEEHGANIGLGGPPTVVRFQRHKRVAEWRGGSLSLLRWMQKQSLPWRAPWLGLNKCLASNDLPNLPPALLEHDSVATAAHLGLLGAVFAGTAWVGMGGIPSCDADTVACPVMALPRSGGPPMSILL